MNLYSSVSNARSSETGIPSRYPLVPAKMIATCRSTGQRLVLRLLQNLHQPGAARELRLRRLVEVAAELRERRELAILGEVQPQRAGHLAHRLDLRRPADARHRVADVDGRPDALMEQIRFEEDLAVGDRDDVRRNVRGQVARLRLDDRQRRQRSAAQLRVQLGRALQQPRMQVEHVARIRLAARRPAKQQRDLAIGLRVLREVVIDDQRVPPESRKNSPIVQAE